MASIVEPSHTLPIAPTLSALGLGRATFYRYRARNAGPDPPPAESPPAGSDAPPDAPETAHPSGSEPSSSAAAPSSTPPAAGGTPVPEGTPRGTEMPSAAPARPCRVPNRSLTDEQREAVRWVLFGERFRDHTPPEVFSTLLDEGAYYCSQRTMYRLLKAQEADRPRRRCREHRHYAAPELLATRPNEVWSWDITRLKGPHKWTGYYVYVMLDVFSRYVVGWTVAHHQDHRLAAQLIDEACHLQRIEPGQLTIHADRGGPMTSKTVSLLLSDLGVLRTHSRPHVSNDNPFSEAQFKTLKYCPDFPDRFGSIEHAREHCRRFFHWYNNEHHHSGIADLTPAMVHQGIADQVISRRQALLDAAYQRNPTRFVNGPPRHPSPPEAVWINPPGANRETTPKGGEAAT